MLKVIKVIGFSDLNTCEFTTAINCEIRKLAQMYTFPDQMNWLSPVNGLHHSHYFKHQLHEYILM